jgi:hypothetical protein
MKPNGMLYMVAMDDPTPFDTAWRMRASMEVEFDRKYVIAEHMLTGMHAVVATELWEGDGFAGKDYLLADRAR